MDIALGATRQLQVAKGKLMVSTPNHVANNATSMMHANSSSPPANTSSPFTPSMLKDSMSTAGLVSVADGVWRQVAEVNSALLNLNSENAHRNPDGLPPICSIFLLVFFIVFGVCWQDRDARHFDKKINMK